MHIHDRCEASLRHLCFGNRLSCLKFSKLRYLCPRCGHSHMQRVPFQAQGHRISCELLSYTRDLLAYGFTNKEVAYITGLGKNTVKDIDLRRLQEKYTIDGQRLIKPEKQARFLGVDEFKLHDGHKYAVVIIDMETGPTFPQYGSMDMDFSGGSVGTLVRLRLNITIPAVGPRTCTLCKLDETDVTEEAQALFDR
ncbi:MAG: hypothetical protein GX315_04770 [Spirochaetales bacterium]|nr:hypothetical protein [Spirochaetales bacterium]